MSTAVKTKKARFMARGRNLRLIAIMADDEETRGGRTRKIQQGLTIDFARQVDAGENTPFGANDGLYEVPEGEGFKDPISGEVLTDELGNELSIADWLRQHPKCNVEFFEVVDERPLHEVLQEVTVAVAEHDLSLLEALRADEQAATARPAVLDTIDRSVTLISAQGPSEGHDGSAETGVPAESDPEAA